MDGNGGWIKIHRKIEESQVFQSDRLLKLWVYCLFRANYKDDWFTPSGVVEPIRVKRGQFVTGRYALHKGCYPRKRKGNPSPLTLWRCLQVLEKMGNLNIHSNNKYTVVTIPNYSLYNDVPPEKRGGVSSEVNNSRTTTEQQLNTSKNIQEGLRTKVSADPPPKTTHIAFPGFEDTAPNEGGNGKPKAPTIQDRFEVFWKSVRKLAPHKTCKKQDALRAYRKALVTLKGHPAPHDFLLARAAAYYKSPEGGTVYASGPAPWLNQGRWDDDPASWRRDAPQDATEDEPVNWG